MTTFGDVVDRVYRDWLHGPDEQPIIATLDGAIDASTTSVTIDMSELSAEEQDAFAKGLIFEVEYEQMRIQSVSSSTATVVRGVNGTTAASHSDNVTVTLLPKWGRQTVLDAVLDEVPRLYPDLHLKATTSVVSNSTYQEVPAGVVTITQAYVAYSGRYKNVSGLELLTDFGPSSTDKAVQFPSGLGSGKTVYLAYHGEFDRPADQTVTLSSAGVDTSWVPILAVGAAASVIASEDIDKATVEFITRQLEQQQFPVGSSARLRDGLLRYRQYLIEQARRVQRAQEVTPVKYTQAVYP